MCILCKQKPEEYTKGLIIRLELDGIHARIENEYQDLLKKPLVILIMSSMKLVNNRRMPDEWDYVMDEMSSLIGVSRQECGKDSYYKMQDSNDRIYISIEELVGKELIKIDDNLGKNNVIVDKMKK